MSAIIAKVGIVSCSGESIPEGTISRLATRRVLELLRPDKAVTICLPLFVAGNEGERNFAKTHPTIAIDGCPKQVRPVGHRTAQRTHKWRDCCIRNPGHFSNRLQSLIAGFINRRQRGCLVYC